MSNSLEDNEEHIIPYHTLNSINENQFSKLNNVFELTTKNIKQISVTKAIKLISQIYTLCRLHYISLENKKIRALNKNKHHPIQPIRGEIYNALITENIGSEICDNHLVIVISNPKTNIFAEKINVVPIEGDGNTVPKYLVRLDNNDLIHGKLDKEPSRVIIPEIMTIDKARLGIKIGLIKDEKMLEINKKILSQLNIKIKDLRVDN